MCIVTVDETFAGLFRAATFLKLCISVLAELWWPHIGLMWAFIFPDRTKNHFSAWHEHFRSSMATTNFHWFRSNLKYSYSLYNAAASIGTKLAKLQNVKQGFSIQSIFHTPGPVKEEQIVVERVVFSLDFLHAEVEQLEWTQRNIVQILRSAEVYSNIPANNVAKYEPAQFALVHEWREYKTNRDRPKSPSVPWFGPLFHGYSAIVYHECHFAFAQAEAFNMCGTYTLISPKFPIKIQTRTHSFSIHADQFFFRRPYLFILRVFPFLWRI